MRLLYSPSLISTKAFSIPSHSSPSSAFPLARQETHNPEILNSKTLKPKSLAFQTRETKLLKTETLKYQSPILTPILNPTLNLKSRARVRVKRVQVMASSVDPPEGYRQNVGVCLVNSVGHVFVASRLDFPGAWQMPQGGIDEGEEGREAAIRELREETGVTSAEIIGETPVWLAYDFPPEVRERITRLWGKPWKGQAQKWFLLRFLGEDSEISLLGDGSEKPEFGAWKWVPPEEVITAAVDFKRPVYEQVFSFFGPILAPKSV